MSDPKLHHYVPQFYLRRFCDASITSQKQAFMASDSFSRARTTSRRYESLREQSAPMSTLDPSNGILANWRSPDGLPPAC